MRKREQRWARGHGGACGKAPGAAVRSTFGGAVGGIVGGRGVH